MKELNYRQYSPKNRKYTEVTVKDSQVDLCANIVDKDGQVIYQNDIVEFNEHLYLVSYKNLEWTLLNERGWHTLFLDDNLAKECKVAGNISNSKYSVFRKISNGEPLDE